MALQSFKISDGQSSVGYLLKSRHSRNYPKEENRMIYFDNAATTNPKPSPVINTVKNTLLRLSANPGRSGHALSQEAAAALYGAREKVADFFSCSGSERVIFTPSCTVAINTVLKGLLNRGDRVVTSDLEHNAVMRPLRKTGAQIAIAKVSFESPDNTFRSFEELVDANTKLVICTAASNVTGTLLPIDRIGRLCKKHGVLFAVDAAQAAGVVPINMRDMCIDFLCVAPHKGLYAPMGTGILIAEQALGDTLIEGGTGSNSADLTQPLNYPEGFESGTVNLSGIAGIGAGIDFVNKRGFYKIYSHEMRLADMLYKGLAKTDKIILYTPSPNTVPSAPVISFNVSGLPSGETAALLDRKGIALRAGLHCAPTAHKRLGTSDSGTVRFAPSVFNTKEEVNFLLNALKNIKV